MSAILEQFDVVVIGGGHAGIEAAHAAWKIGVKTAMVTMDLNAIGRMSCNPAVGGVSKGQIVRDIDALGGLMGILTDKAGIQFRMLNQSKGPAVWGPRAQCDLKKYSECAREALESCVGLHLIPGELAAFEKNADGNFELTLLNGARYETRTLIITSGTFLASKMFTGLETSIGGRVGEPSADALSKSIQANGLQLRRLKTGTPSRLDPSTIHFEECEVQPGDANPWPMSDRHAEAIDNGNVCWITRTNLKTHEILRSGFKDSPMFSGRIQGKGPRYCPSIEDKINRFGDKDGHQLFMEPETKDVSRIYLNGFSSSLPADVQLKALHTIPGLSEVRVMQIGYAVEYDSIDATQLYPTFECKRLSGLYFAGQVCGTSGYEEAAAQGLMAGINAALYVDEKPPFTLNRDEAYIGVLIDDLVTKGTNEPYRMMTARAEYRLRLRQDNADLRLTEKGYALGLATEERLKKMQERREEIERIVRLSETVKIKKENGGIFERYEGVQVEKTMPVKEALKHPGITFDVLKEVTNAFSEFSKSALFSAEVMIKYAGYLEKEDAAIRDARRLEEKILPEDIDYNALSGLRIEARQKLSKIRPATLGQASRISGVSPADITVLLIYLKTAK